MENKKEDMVSPKVKDVEDIEDLKIQLNKAQFENSQLEVRLNNMTKEFNKLYKAYLNLLSEYINE